MKQKTLIILFGILNISFIVVMLYLYSLQPDYRNLFQYNINSFINVTLVYYIAFSIILLFVHFLDWLNDKNELNLNYND